MSIISLVLLGLAPILLVAALMVRFAGANRILNFVDYSTISNAPELHRWAGGRLLVLPFAAAFLGATSARWPHLAFPSFLVLMLTVVVVVSWLTYGVERFCGRR